MADAVGKVERRTTVHIHLAARGDDFVEGDMADTADVCLVEMMHDLSFTLAIIVEKSAKLQNHFRIGKFSLIFVNNLRKMN